MLKEWRDSPSLRLATVVEAVGEQGPEIGGEVGGAAFLLGAGGAEGDEPVPEDGAGHHLQRLVHPVVQVDLVVEGAEDRCNRTLVP